MIDAAVRLDAEREVVLEISPEGAHELVAPVQAIASVLDRDPRPRGDVRTVETTRDVGPPQNRRPPRPLGIERVQRLTIAKLTERALRGAAVAIVDEVR